MRANPASKKKISLRSGDQVEVIAGREKGRRGKILRLLKDKDRVLVEGINKVKRHVKPTQSNPQGGIVEKEISLHISNVMVVDPKSNKPTRVGKKLEKGKWIRVARKSGAELKVVQAAAAKGKKSAATKTAKAAKKA